MKNILITGACGQIGTELTIFLRDKYGIDKVITSDIRKPSESMSESGLFVILDVTNIQSVKETVQKYNVGCIYHLAAILSATGEKNPELAWNVNMNGLYNILEVSREYKCAVFIPSSIAVFGPETPKNKTPQDTIQRPTSIYGITKVAGELLADYYYKKYGVDTRGLRYPGLISYLTPPGGGTTDYAVEIFYEAIKNKSYTCFLKEDTMLDMMYMPDALEAAVKLMEADPNKLKHRNAFNVTAFSITPKILAEKIKKYIPEFKITYNVDPVRQAIADSWPNNMDDSVARKEWGWEPKYDLEMMTKDMIEKLKMKLKKGV